MAVLRTVLKWFGTIVGVAVAYLLAVGLAPGLKAPAQPLPKGSRPTGGTEEQPPRSRTSVSFAVKGTPVSAWLYLPEDLSASAPCIVMGHGLGGTKDFGLEAYAVRFQQAGFAVLVFDYRHLGESGGEPRQLIWIPYQLEDWSAAVEYTRGLAEVDPARIALWGTSLSGGHVIVTAAEDGRIACVTAQVPALDMRAAAMHLLKTEGVGHFKGEGKAHAHSALTIVHAQRDLVRSWLGLSPHKMPLVGKPGTVAVMSDADAWASFVKLAPEGFVNEVCARIFLRVDKYRPIMHAADVRCPVLLQICDYDTATPPPVVADAVSRLGGLAEVKRYPIGHFDIYTGEGFEMAVRDQIDFFEKHLHPARADAES